ncbi:enoyl-CoA hydratase [Sneathiella sp.]|jgi:enoyl-CoA hydratase/carnithine racemase|uniref:enoyl-CoA hydratase n=1 Tax=Sneathiella sp. TaxID=1964365 RepID=UPI0025E72313|nr:enoyl-CoA hydratase [Sneathiella sp.]
MANFILTEIEERAHGKVARLAIDNQRKLNTLNTAVIKEFAETMDRLDEDKDIAVLVITGAGNKSFIGGADINLMAGLDPESAREFITSIHMTCHKARFFHAPVIARVNGFCLGAGMELAAACDIVVAGKSASFAMPEVRVGIPSVVEAALLPKILGLNLARDLVMTGRSINAEEAYTAGLVQRLCEDEALDAATETAIEEILEGGRNAMAIQKQLCNDWENNALEDGIQMGIDAFARAYESDEPGRMMGAFINRPR